MPCFKLIFINHHFLISLKEIKGLLETCDLLYCVIPHHWSSCQTQRQSHISSWFASRRLFYIITLFYSLLGLSGLACKPLQCLARYYNLEFCADWNCCQTRAHRNWLPKSHLQPSDAASCSQGSNLRNTCLGHPALQSGKVSWEVSSQRKESHAASPRRSWEETLGGRTPPVGSVPFDQPTPSLPQSRKSIHVFSSVTSYYFWIGNPKEFLTEAWRKNKPLCPSPQDKHFQHRKKIRALEVPNPCLRPSTHVQDTPSSSPGSGSSQSRFAPRVPNTSHHLACICRLSAIWDFLRPLFSVAPSLHWRATSHRPGVTSLLPTPRNGAATAPTSLLPWGKSFLPRFPLGSVFLTDNAKKSVCIPRRLQQLWDFSLSRELCNSAFPLCFMSPDLLSRLAIVAESPRHAGCFAPWWDSPLGRVCLGTGRDPARSSDCSLSQVLGHSCITSSVNL